MTFIKNNREIIVLVAVITAIFVMGCGLAYNFRGSNPWAY